MPIPLRNKYSQVYFGSSTRHPINSTRSELSSVDWYVHSYTHIIKYSFINKAFYFCISEQISDSASDSTNNFAFEPQIGLREQSPGFDELNTEIEQARLHSIALEKSRTAIKDKIAKKEKKKDKKKKKNLTSSDSDINNMSEIEATEQLNGAAGNDIPAEMLPSQQILEEEAREREAEEERRRNREPAIVFNEVDVSSPIIGKKEAMKLK